MKYEFPEVTITPSGGSLPAPGEVSIDTAAAPALSPGRILNLAVVVPVVLFLTYQLARTWRKL